jgi:lysine/ornithine N-monooxygenase
MIIADGQREGWYRIAFGEVEQVRSAEGKIITTVCGKANQPMFTLNTDFVIDCTGLESSLDSNPLLADLLGRYQLRRNAKRRLYVTNDFEVPDMGNKIGRMYAAGVMTLGGPYAPVDSFLGLQYAAFRSVNHLKSLDARGLRGLGTYRSITQFARWAGGNTP